MNILVLGGTGFIGAHVVRQLADEGHGVTVFTRGKKRVELPPSVRYMTGDYKNLPAYNEQFRRFAPQVVVDMIAMTETDATNVVGTFRGLARRLVAASSQDVYQAWGYVLGTDTGPVDPLITEESPLRQSRFPYRNRRLPAFREWDIDNYDKVLVEQALRSEPSLPVTLLRLPMVYGPGDYARRTYAWAKRMDDGRSVIPLEKPLARWHGPMGYVEDVASAFALAVVNDAARGRTYNVAESDVRSTAQFIRDIGAAMNWEGHVVELPPGSMPGPWTSYRLDQDVITDSTCIRQELGYRESVPRLTAMRQAVQWELAHPPHPLPAELFNYAAEDQVLAKLDVSAGGGAL